MICPPKEAMRITNKRQPKEELNQTQTQREWIKRGIQPNLDRGNERTKRGTNPNPDTENELTERGTQHKENKTEEGPNQIPTKREWNKRGTNSNLTKREWRTKWETQPNLDRERVRKRSPTKYQQMERIKANGKEIPLVLQFLIKDDGAC